MNYRLLQEWKMSLNDITQFSSLPTLDTDSVPLNQKKILEGLPQASGIIGPDVADSGTPPKDDVNQSYYISNWNNFKTSFSQAASTGLPAVIYKSAKNFFDEHIFDSPVASNLQIEEAKKGRPGIVFPEGAHENLVNSIVNNYDSNAVRENILAHAKPTFEGSISGFAGSALGSTIADPISTGLAIGAGALTHNVFDVPEFLGLERTAYSLAFERTVQGAAEGATFGGAQALGDKLDDIARGDDLTPVHAMRQIGDNMLLGGILHPIGGALADLFKSNRAFPIPEAEDASSTASLMGANGKDVQPQIALRNAFNQASKQFKAKIADMNLQESDVANALDERQSTIENLPETPDLKLEKRSIEVHRAMLQNTEEEIPKDVMDNFIKLNQSSSSDFANGRGQKEMDVSGPTTTDANNLVNEKYPPDRQKDILNNAELTEQDNVDLDNINKSQQHKKLLSDALKSTFQCILGTQS